MLLNYFVSILRSIRNQKIYFIINTLGLTLGISSAIIIFMILSFETSFDNYHHDSDRIYRVVSEVVRYGQDDFRSGVPYRLPETLKLDFPQLEKVSIVDFNFNDMLITIPSKDGSSKKFLEKQQVALVGDDFFTIFHYDWLEGNKRDLVTKTNTVVLSKSFAKKYFGNSDPIGKTINIDNETNHEVVGLVADPPKNTDFPFGVIIPYEHLSFDAGTSNWGSISSGVQCIVKLPANMKPSTIDAGFDSFLKKHMDPEDWSGLKMWLQPLSEVHYDDRFNNPSERNFSESKIYTLGIIGMLLLLVSCINFVNLKTALSAVYAKEVGIRKVLGSSRWQIALRFFGEALFLTFGSITISLIIVEVVLSQLKYFTGYELTFSQIGFTNIFMFLAAIALITGILAGIYPSMVISGYQPVKAIKAGRVQHSQRKLTIRKALVVFQFIVSEALIIATIIVNNQLDYLTHADMGFDKSAVLEVNLPLRKDELTKAFKTSLLQNPDIESVGYSNTGAASTNRWSGDCDVFINNKKNKFSTEVKFVNSGYLDTYKLNLLAGKNINDENSENEFVVNQEFVKRLGFGDNYQKAIGTRMNLWSREGIIIGVVKNFNTVPLEEKIDPVAITNSRKIYDIAGIKLKTNSIKETLAHIENAFHSVYPDYVFDYSFLDSTVEKFYEDDMRFSRLINIFSLIAIIIGCMGIFGLSAFSAINRTKEIGIRKVLGATVTSIITLLSKDFILLVAVSNIIAWPLAYYFMNNWIANFAYHISIGAWIFLAGGAVTLLIAVITVGYHSLKAAVANPTESLHYE